MSHIKYLIVFIFIFISISLNAQNDELIMDEIKGKVDKIEKSTNLKTLKIYKQEFIKDAENLNPAILFAFHLNKDVKKIITKIEKTNKLEATTYYYDNSELIYANYTENYFKLTDQNENGADIYDPENIEEIKKVDYFYFDNKLKPVIPSQILFDESDEIEIRNNILKTSKELFKLTEEKLN